MSAPENPRRGLIALFEDELPRSAGKPKYRVGGSNVFGQPISVPTVAVWQDSVQRVTRLKMTALTFQLKVAVLVGVEDQDKADAVLDEALLDVLAVLEPATWIQWDSAQRTKYDDTAGHAYELTVTAVGTIDSESRC